MAAQQLRQRSLELLVNLLALHYKVLFFEETKNLVTKSYFDYLKKIRKESSWDLPYSE